MGAAGFVAGGAVAAGAAAVPMAPPCWLSSVLGLFPVAIASLAMLIELMISWCLLEQIPIIAPATAQGDTGAGGNLTKRAPGC